jgi:hypothetical protein
MTPATKTTRFDNLINGHPMRPTRITRPARGDLKNPPGTLCHRCRLPVEPQRLVYAIPTCYACLPPPAFAEALLELARNCGGPPQ